MLALIFETDDVGQIEFSVILYKMRLYIDPLWLKLTQVLALDNPFELRHKNLRKRMANLLKSMGQVPPQPVQQLKPPDMKISFISTDSKFVLIEDFTDETSSAIILSSHFLLEFNQLEKHKDPLRFSITSMSIDSFSCDKHVPMIEPFQLSITIKDKNKKNDSFKNIVTATKRSPNHVLLIGDCKEISMRLSYQDALMLVRIANRYKEGAKKIKVFSKIADDKKQADQDKINQKISKSTSKSTSKTTLQQPARPPMFRIKGAQIDIPSIDFTIVDDCADADVPLIQFILLDCFTFYRKYPDDQVLDLSLKIELNYYNRNISAFEPIIEEYEPRIILNLC